MSLFLAGFSISGKIFAFSSDGRSLRVYCGSRNHIPANVRRAIDFEPVLIFGGKENK